MDILDVMLEKAVPVGPKGEAVEFVIGNGGNVEEDPKLATSLEILDSSMDDLVDTTVGSELGCRVPENERDPPVGPPTVIDEFVNGNGADFVAAEVIIDKVLDIGMLGIVIVPVPRV